MQPIDLLLQLLCVCFIIGYGYSLMEHDVGKHDWTYTLLGNTNQIEFSKQNLWISSASSNQSLYLLSNLLITDGTIQARRPSSEPFQHILSFNNDFSASISSQCSIISFWNSKLQLLWSKTLSSSENCKLVTVSNTHFAVVSKEKITVFSKDGKIHFSQEASANSFYFAISKDTVAQFYIDELKKQIFRAEIYSITASSLSKVKEVSSLQIPYPSSLTSDGIFVQENIGHVMIENTPVTIPFNMHTSTISYLNQLIYVADWKHFKVVTYKLSETSKIEKLEEKENTIIVVINSQTVTITKQQSSLVFKIGQSEKNEYKNLLQNRGTLKRVYAATESTANLFLICQFQDESLVAIQNGKIQWIREEALASAKDSQFVDLPFQSASSQASDFELVSSLPTRIIYQMQQLQKTIVDAFSFLQSSQTVMEHQKDALLHQDRFGFQKLIITVSASGKIFAMHSLTGQILWSQFINELLQEGEQVVLGDSVPSISVFVTKSQTFAEIVVEPQITVLIRKNGKTHVTTLDAVFGTIQNKEVFSFEYKDAILLPEFEPHTHVHPILLFGSEASTVSVYPKNKDLTAFVEEKSKTTFFYRVNKITSSVEGYVYSHQLKKLVLNWSVELKNPIISIAKQNSLPQNIYSNALEYNNDLLFKYLNAHLFAVATLDASTNQLDIYLMDGVTGSVVFRTAVPNVNGPVHMLVDEHTFLCHYLNHKAKRFELLSVELYMNQTLEQASSTTPLISTVNLPEPYSMRQTFIFPSAITSLSITKTLHGVTTKQYLFGLPKGQIMALNRKMVDPKRPMGAPTPIEQEDGLIQYSPYIPLNPMWIISYFQTVYGIVEIDSSPCHLESFSHIFASGLDIFYTRTTPSKPFDLLNEDFSYLLLIGTIVSLLAVTFWSRNKAAKKQVKLAWM